MPGRRQLLQSLCAGLLVACKPGVTSDRLAGRTVVIVGAGMAGAKAARDLADTGADVVVLEARSRTGGRLWTDRSLGVPLDMGGGWIHGRTGNPLTALAQQLNVDAYEWDYDDITMVGPVSPALNRTASRIERALYDGDVDVDDAGSLQDVIDQLGRQGMFDGLTLQERDWFVHMQLELELAAEADRLAAHAYTAGEAFDGPDVLLPGGYQQLVDGLLQDIDVRLDTEVIHIRHGPEGTIIHTHNLGLIPADAVIVTAPLGVLRAGAITFEPDLPPAHRRALQSLDMGLLHKTYLSFPHAFWPETHMISRVTERKAWAAWFNLEDMTGQPILMALNAGEAAYTLEAMDDEAIAAKAMQELRQMAQTSIPDPQHVKTSRWGQDVFSRGAYSILPVGADTDDHAQLAKPASNRLHFAGEATSDTYPSTVHGAFLSGERAAWDIMEVL